MISNLGYFAIFTGYRTKKYNNHFICPYGQYFIIAIIIIIMQVIYHFSWLVAAIYH